MDEFGLPVLPVRTFTHSNQRICEEFQGVVRGHAGGQQFVRTGKKYEEKQTTIQHRKTGNQNTGKTGQ
jgi:hypothetical protein